MSGVGRRIDAVSEAHLSGRYNRGGRADESPVRDALAEAALGRRESLDNDAPKTDLGPILLMPGSSESPHMFAAEHLIDRHVDADNDTLNTKSGSVLDVTSTRYSVIDIGAPPVSGRSRVRTAIAKMEERRKRFTVVVRGDQVLGCITKESVLHALLAVVDSTLDTLSIHDVLLPPKMIQHSEELWYVWDMLEHQPVLFLKWQDKDPPRHAIDREDVATFLRDYAEDLMRIQSIETQIRSAIRQYEDANGEPSRPLTKSGLDRYLEGVDQCLSAAGERDPKKLSRARNAVMGRLIDGDEPNSVETLKSIVGKLTRRSPDDELFESTYREYCYSRHSENQTFGQYAGFLMAASRWQWFNTHLAIGGSSDLGEERAESRMRSLRETFDRVRGSRNKLMHFNGLLTSDERERVRFLEQWVNRLDRFDERVDASAAGPSEEPGAQGPVSDEQSSEEPEVVGESPFMKLARRLRNQQARHDVSFTFTEIEDITGATLPHAAREKRSWWSNSESSPQASRWLESDWRVVSVNMTSEEVRFRRVKDRERQYIRFFSRLIGHLSESDDRPNPTGTSWLKVETIKSEDGTRLGQINVAFGFHNVIRSEFYIDNVSDPDLNRHVYAYLKQRIEDTLPPEGAEPLWDPLEDKNVCRIALVRAGSVDADESNELLMEQVAGDIGRLSDAIKTRLSGVTVDGLRSHQGDAAN